MNLIERVGAAMATDDDGDNKQSAKLTDLYKESAPWEQNLLDAAFTCLCGYSLRTLIYDPPEELKDKYPWT